MSDSSVDNGLVGVPLLTREDIERAVRKVPGFSG